MTLVRSLLFHWTKEQRVLWQHKKAVQSALCICKFHIHRFSQPWIQKYSGKKTKNSRKFQKTKLEYAIHRQLFTWHLHCTSITSNLEMTKYTEGCAQVVCKYTISYKGLEHPQILVSKVGGPGTNPPQLPRDHCICLRTMDYYAKDLWENKPSILVHNTVSLGFFLVWLS